MQVVTLGNSTIPAVLHANLMLVSNLIDFFYSTHSTLL